jgi:hypothetical protein
MSALPPIATLIANFECPLRAIADNAAMSPRRPKQKIKLGTRKRQTFTQGFFERIDQLSRAPINFGRSPNDNGNRVCGRRLRLCGLNDDLRRAIFSLEIPAVKPAASQLKQERQDRI